MPIETESRESSTARVPAVEPGRAIIVTRYDDEKAVILHPADFRRLAAIDEALADIARAERGEVSDLVRKAHRLEDEPGRPLEDAAAIKTLLGL